MRSPELMGILSGLTAAVVFLITHGLAVHVAYCQGAGLIGIALTLVLPILAEVYWIVRLWQTNGSVINSLTVPSLMFVLLVASTYAYSVASREAA